MDTLTHIVLGACIGELVAGRQLGKKALVIGALAQSIPDVDFVASFWMPVAQDLVAHRGFTHSLLFMALVSPLLAWLSQKLFPKSGISYRRWLFFWGLQLFIHLFIDCFNAYGTGLFVPFSNYRVTFNTLFVADPLFSLWPGIACIVLFIIRTAGNNRRRWAWAGLAMSVAYLVLAIAVKLYIDTSVKNELQKQGVSYSRYFATPTPLNSMLWYIVAENGSGYYAGYKSVFDTKPGIDFRYVFRNDSLFGSYQNSADLALLKRFSRGYYTAEMWHDTLVFNNLCFGEIVGWCEQQPKFVCHYYMQYPGDNAMIVQRGRFEKWNKRTLSLFFDRIKGN